MDFHLIELMMRHGCFGSYLFRIRQEPSPGYRLSEANFDDAAHTLIACPAWWKEHIIIL